MRQQDVEIAENQKFMSSLRAKAAEEAKLAEIKAEEEAKIKAEIKAAEEAKAIADAKTE